MRGPLWILLGLLVWLAIDPLSFAPRLLLGAMALAGVTAAVYAVPAAASRRLNRRRQRDPQLGHERVEAGDNVGLLVSARQDEQHGGHPASVIRPSGTSALRVADRSGPVCDPPSGRRNAHGEISNPLE